MYLKGWIGDSRLSAQANSFTFCHRSDRNRVIVQFGTRRGRFTDKGTPGAILGRKAKAFEICDLRFAICD